MNKQFKSIILLIVSLSYVTSSTHFQFLQDPAQPAQKVGEPIVNPLNIDLPYTNFVDTVEADRTDAWINIKSLAKGDSYITFGPSDKLTIVGARINDAPATDSDKFTDDATTTNIKKGASYIKFTADAGKYVSVHIKVKHADPAVAFDAKYSYYGNIISSDKLNEAFTAIKFEANVATKILEFKAFDSLNTKRYTYLSVKEDNAPLNALVAAENPVVDDVNALFSLAANSYTRVNNDSFKGKSAFFTLTRSGPVDAEATYNVQISSETNVFSRNVQPSPVGQVLENAQILSKSSYFYEVKGVPKDAIIRVVGATLKVATRADYTSLAKLAELASAGKVAENGFKKIDTAGDYLFEITSDKNVESILFAGIPADADGSTLLNIPAGDAGKTVKSVKGTDAKVRQIVSLIDANAGKVNVTFDADAAKELTQGLSKISDKDISTKITSDKVSVVAISSATVKDKFTLEKKDDYKDNKKKVALTKGTEKVLVFDTPKGDLGVNVVVNSTKTRISGNSQVISKSIQDAEYLFLNPGSVFEATSNSKYFRVQTPNFEEDKYTVVRITAIDQDEEVEVTYTQQNSSYLIMVGLTFLFALFLF